MYSRAHDQFASAVIEVVLGVLTHERFDLLILNYRQYIDAKINLIHL